MSARESGICPVGGISGCLIVAALCGCATGEEPTAPSGSERSDWTRWSLEATQYNAGRSGEAYLIRSGEHTIVRVEVSGVPGTITRPVHLYTYVYAGSCAARESEPLFALTDTVLASSVARPSAIGAYVGAMTVANVAPVAFASLRAKPYAIVVRSAPADGDHELFCGDGR